MIDHDAAVLCVIESCCRRYDANDDDACVTTEDDYDLTIMVVAAMMIMMVVLMNMIMTTTTMTTMTHKEAPVPRVEDSVELSSTPPSVGLRLMCSDGNDSQKKKKECCWT